MEVKRAFNKNAKDDNRERKIITSFIRRWCNFQLFFSIKYLQMMYDVLKNLDVKKKIIFVCNEFMVDLIRQPALSVVVSKMV